MNKIKPSYYTQGNEDLITYFANNFNRDKFIGFMTGNIIKYVVRFDGKNGLEDLSKAKEYIERLYSELENKEKYYDVKIPNFEADKEKFLENLDNNKELDNLDSLNKIKERNRKIDEELENEKLLDELETEKLLEELLNEYLFGEDDGED